MILALDIDGVLANFNLHCAKKFIEITKEDRFPENWYMHPERLCPVWDWWFHWGYTEKQRKAVFAKMEKANPPFWYDLPIMPLVKDSLFCLNRRAMYHGDQVYFLTHRLGDTAKIQTERWLYQYGLAYPTVLIVAADKKYTVLDALGADVFIDDKLETVRSAIGHAKRVYLQDAPHNQLPTAEENNARYTRIKTVQHMLEAEGIWQPSDAKSAMFWRK